MQRIIIIQLKNLQKFKKFLLIALLFLFYYIFFHFNQSKQLDDLLIKIQDSINSSYNHNNLINQYNLNPIKSIKIFCIILTTSNGYKKEKTQTVLNVWANKCDNFKFITLLPNSLETENKIINSTDQNLNVHSLVLNPRGFSNDKYSLLTDKVLLSFKQIYREYNSYDWYLKADDDTFIEIDNLREFLKEKNPNEPITFGYDFKVIVENGYHSGGGGYVLSKEAFQRIGHMLNFNYTFCKVTGTEDVDVARCLRRLNVLPSKSIDEFGRERFNALDIIAMYTGNVPDWLISYAANPIKNGTNCCSDSFISFHYMSPKDMIRLESVIKRLAYVLNENNTSGKYIRPTFKSIIESYINMEKLEKEMESL